MALGRELGRSRLEVHFRLVVWVGGGRGSRCWYRCALLVGLLAAGGKPKRGDRELKTTISEREDL